MITFLGLPWSAQKCQELLVMCYWQQNHDKEMLMEFFICRLQHLHLLIPVPPRCGLVEFLIADMPVEWNQWTHPKALLDASKLLRAAYQYEKELIAATDHQKDIKTLLQFKTQMENGICPW
ncbi:hypothetical protein FRB94_014019 [Tulasnella sp. JGI-2019a]|nr:hypothetical protein FRB93_010133 [Tulasnella sp. JGI-2019a]KAG8989780.1 hypothetical protein FRB94_014019 [Tulasnella sp. JGI-2019a]KAG9023372.1 hypothetical protein FRB95_013193 [Tulasnella sp. JGI-2019a]